MLPSANRLKRQKDIEKVFKKGIGFKEDFLILKTVKSGLKNSRFAFVVSKKISTKATTRNKIRRRLSELVRSLLKKVKSPAKDAILMAGQGLEKQDFWEMEKSLVELFKKAKFL